jgi:acetoacetyl-CoA reductase
MKKTVLITGASKGIGEATAKEFYNSGYTVIGTYNSTIPKLDKDYSGIIYKKLDITSFEQCKEMLLELQSTNLFPEILVNNAGITKDRMFHKMNVEDWRDVINTNLVSLFNITQPVFCGMRELGFGRIINISSINANKGQAGQANYCAAKAGIQGFTKALALEGAKYGIRVNTISPGYTATDMVNKIKPEILDKIKATIPTGSLVSTNEIAKNILFLASDASSSTTGANFEINGGMYSS